MQCFYKNEYKMARSKRECFSIKLSRDIVYDQIDTMVFYKSYRYKNSESGIKFYKDGKVGYFHYVDYNDSTALNPKRALMGVYKIENGQIYMEFLARNPQAGYFFLREEGMVKDSILITKGTGRFNKDTTLYIKQKIPTNWLIYSPDW